MKIVWLKPAKGQISIGRKLIAERLRDKNIELDMVECSGFRFFKILLEILSSDYDLVIGTTHLGLVLGGLVKIIKKIPFITDFVDEYELLFTKNPGLYPIVLAIVLLEELSLKIADAVIVTPQRMFVKLSRDRVMVFKTNLCIDLDKFLYSGHLEDHARKLLERNGIKQKQPKIIYVGGFSEVYNLDILLESMKYLPDFQLIMIGGGRLENKLNDLKKELNLKNVYFLGYLPNDVVAEVMKLCDVGVTLCEVPRQLKIYEYLATGLRVVVPESVLSSKDFEFAEYCTGTKMDARDVAENIKRALSMPRKRDKMLVRLLEKYSCSRVTEKYARVVRILF
ncbi:glycosyltransferase [Archaeoglobus sulfaticallidus]|nr:glycosyltransferase [Archaeoglobus sulfaticallidus]